MPPEEAQNLVTIAAVAAVAEDLDKIIDQLFENVAELKLILAQAGSPAPGSTKEEP